MNKALSREEAKRFYDRFGSKQDSQSFYEDRALSRLIEHASFERAASVFELGCGTGRFAQRLLENYLGPGCRYEAADLSTTMVALAYARLDRFGARVTVREGDWSALHDPRASFDRIVSSYVLDLLPEQAIANVIDASARALAEGGRLCLVGLTFGNTPLSRIVAGGWHALFRLSPRLVGGCRPIRLRPRFEMGGWHLVHHSVVTSFGVPSEVVVADRLSA